MSAPRDVLPLIDRFVELIDQSPVANAQLIRQYALSHAEAPQMMRTLQRVFDSARTTAGGNAVSRAMFSADDRTNTLLVTASDDQHAEVARLLGSLDAPISTPDATLEIIEVVSAAPTRVVRVVERVLSARGETDARTLSVQGEDDLGLLLVIGTEEDIARVPQADPVSERVGRLRSSVIAELRRLWLRRRMKISRWSKG